MTMSQTKKGDREMMLERWKENSEISKTPKYKYKETDLYLYEKKLLDNENFAIDQTNLLEFFLELSNRSKIAHLDGNVIYFATLFPFL